MNFLDHTVIEIVKGPYQRIDSNLCCWEVVAKVDCFGQITEKTFQNTSKVGIEMYCPGYTYLA